MQKWDSLVTALEISIVGLLIYTPTVREAASLSPLQHALFCVLLTAVLTGVRWNLCGGLMHISLWLKMLNTSCTYWPFGLFKRSIYSVDLYLLMRLLVCGGF